MFNVHLNGFMKLYVFSWQYAFKNMKKITPPQGKKCWIYLRHRLYSFYLYNKHLSCSQFTLRSLYVVCITIVTPISSRGKYYRPISSRAYFPQKNHPCNYFKYLRYNSINVVESRKLSLSDKATW